MIVDEDVYLAHHGVKGMKWGVRKKQAANAARSAGRGAAVAGSVAWKGAKVVGRGTERAAIWTKEHPKQAATIAVGAAFVAIHLRAKARQTRQGEAISKGYKFIKATMASSAAPSTPIPRGSIKPEFKTIRKSASLIKQTPDAFRKVRF